MYLCINNDVSCIISAISFSITARIIVTIVQILQLFQKFKIKYKILIAAQKFKKILKKYKFVRFCKEIFDKDNFDKFLLIKSTKTDS